MNADEMNKATMKELKVDKEKKRIKMMKGLQVFGFSVILFFLSYILDMTVYNNFTWGLYMLLQKVMLFTGLYFGAVMGHYIHASRAIRDRQLEKLENIDDLDKLDDEADED